MLPLASSEQIRRRLERELSKLERPILAFDADGTLWSGDVGIELFEALLEKESVGDEAMEALGKLADRFGVAKASTPTGQAIELYEAFREGRLPEDLAFAMMAWAYAGFDEAALVRFIDAELDFPRLKMRLHAEVLPLLDWARDAAVPVAIVSASPRAVIVRAVERLSLSVAHVVAMTPAMREGRVEPRVLSPIPYGDGKVEALVRSVPDAEILGAFGDSGYDAAMLARARVKVAVRPKASLLERAGEIPGLVRLAEAT